MDLFVHTMCHRQLQIGSKVLDKVKCDKARMSYLRNYRNEG